LLSCNDGNASGGETAVVVSWKIVAVFTVVEVIVSVVVTGGITSATVTVGPRTGLVGGGFTVVASSAMFNGLLLMLVVVLVSSLTIPAKPDATDT
jgi:uncharacterized membrane protein